MATSLSRQGGDVASTEKLGCVVMGSNWVVEREVYVSKQIGRVFW